MQKHHLALAVIITYLLLSFVPQLGLREILSRARGGGKKQ